MKLLIEGELAQMVERSLSMREALGSIPRFSNFFEKFNILLYEKSLIYSISIENYVFDMIFNDDFYNCKREKNLKKYENINN